MLAPGVTESSIINALVWCYGRFSGTENSLDHFTRRLADRVLVGLTSADREGEAGPDESAGQGRSSGKAMPGQLSLPVLCFPGAVLSKLVSQNCFKVIQRLFAPEPFCFQTQFTVRHGNQSEQIQETLRIRMAGLAAKANLARESSRPLTQEGGNAQVQPIFVSQTDNTFILSC